MRFEPYIPCVGDTVMIVYEKSIVKGMSGIVSHILKDENGDLVYWVQINGKKYKYSNPSSMEVIERKGLNR